MPAPSSTPTDPAVRARGVSVTFAGGVRALDGVSVDADRGELVGLVGPNGSGKSTLLKALFGVVPVDGGSVEALGFDPRRDARRLRARAGYAGQDAALDPEMTGWETLHLFHALHGLPRRERARRLGAVVDDFGLADFCGRAVGAWSGGQRQRLHLALATLHAPDLVLLDEPTAGLDPDGRRDLWRRLADWRAASRTVLVATHDLADASAACGRVLVMKAGRIVADGSPAALVAAHAKARATITLACPIAPGSVEEARSALAALGDEPWVEIDGATVTLWRDRHPDGREPALDVLAARGLAHVTYEREEPDLAAAYFRLTGARRTAAAPARPGRGMRRRA
jgi:ABC-type multidrug transport system ATPase subunit